MREGWKNVCLEDVAKVVNGGTPKTNVSEFWGGEHLWITPAEMGGLDSPYLNDSRRKLTDSGLQGSSASLVPENSVILSTRAPIGHLVINDKPMAFNQGCRGIVAGKDAFYKFIYYFLFSNVELLNDLGSGTTFKELSAGKLKKVNFPLPSLEEQKRIVAMLDEAFEGIDTVVANTEKNLANARELYVSSLGKVFSQPSSEGWGMVEIKDVVAERCSLSYGIVQPGKEFEGGLPIIRPTDLTKKFITLRGLKRIDPEKAVSYTRTTLKGGELLLCVRGSTGTISIADEELSGCNVTRGIVPINFNPEVVCQSFGYYLMASPLVQEQIKQKTYGAALMQINIRDLRKLKLAFPVLSDQGKIVKKLDEISAEVKRLEAIYQQKLTALAELKQSMLQKAFSGELTARQAESAVEEATA